MKENQIIASTKDAEIFFDSLKNPKEPSKKLKEAIKNSEKVMKDGFNLKTNKTKKDMFGYLKNVENITNKKATNKVLPHIKVAAQSSIQFSQECLDTIGHVTGNYIFVGKLPGAGFVIASLPEEKAKEEGMGRPLNEGTSKFTNTSIAVSLGGHHSEWKVETSEPVHHDEEGSVWGITQTVDGKEKLAEIEAKKEEEQLGQSPENSVEELEEVEEETASSPVYEADRQVEFN